MDEVFPVVSGAVLGIAVARLRPSLRPWVGVLVSVLLGFAATVVTGEFRIGWEYLLVDIPLVAASAALSLVLARAAFVRLRHSD